MDNVQSIAEVVGPTDAQRAEAIRSALLPLLEEVGRIMDQTKREGLGVSFQIVTDSFGRSRPEIQIVKPL